MIPSDHMMARGMFFRGSLTSSLTVAIRSYPSNAMNVRPMAAATPPSPFGNMGVKLLRVSSGSATTARIPK